MDNKRGAPPLCLVIVSGFLPRYAMQEAEAAGWLAGGPPDLSQILIRLWQKPSKEQLTKSSLIKGASRASSADRLLPL